MSEITEQSLMIVGKGSGRPPRSGVRATERIEIVVTPEEKDHLRRVADEEGKPLASVIRDAVNEFVADYGEKQVFGGSSFR